MNQILYTTILITLLSITTSSSYSDKIKLCNFTTHCPDSNKEFSVDISFNQAPNTIGDGELIKYSDSKLRLKSTPTLSKNKKIVTYKFTPELLGKYYLQFNKNLQCPDVIIVKKNIGVEKMTSSLYITENTMESTFEFDININFNESFIYGEDIKEISLIQKTANETQSNDKRIKSTNCLISNEDKDLKCHFIINNGFEYKTKTKYINILYYNRCNELVSLGNIFVFKTNNKEHNLLTSYLGLLKLYLMNTYKTNKKTVITFLYDPNLKSHKNFIEEHVTYYANLYSEYEFGLMDWKDGQFIAEHFGATDTGYPQITIVDFSNDNEFTAAVKNKDELEEIFVDLKKYTLKWTSQSLMQKIFTFFRIKMNRDEETRFNYFFGIFGFIFIVTLRCFLFARKMSKDQMNFQVNPNPKKTN